MAARQLLGLRMLVLTAALVAGCTPSTPSTSVVLITIDTLRADALGAYGNVSAATPTIDQLAAEGTLFDQAMSQAPATGPSFASMMTSRYPPEVGVLHSTMPLREEYQTLAEVFRKHGYHTAAFVSSSILRSEYGFAQGFETYNEQFVSHYSRNHLERPAELTVGAARAWLGQHGAGPFFLWVHLFDPHAPYLAHGEPGLDPRRGSFKALRRLEQERSNAPLSEAIPAIRALYQAEVAHVDQQVAELLDKLSELGVRRHTMVVVAADHGEELFDHDFFHGHFRSLYESVLHVPLIVSWPGRRNVPARVAHLVENLDIMPTVLSAAGISPPAALRGRDLGALDSSRSDRHAGRAMREPYAGMPGGDAFAVRQGAWKLIYFRRAKNLLFNLHQDPRERQNRISANMQVAARLEAGLEPFGIENAAPSVDPTRLDEEDLEVLKSLGYVR